MTPNRDKRMRKGSIHIIYALFCAAAVSGLAACSEEQYDSSTPRHDAGVTFMVSGISPQTRVDYNGSYVSSRFEGGEELGAYVIDKTGTKNEKGLPEYEFVEGYTRNARYKVVNGVPEVTHTDTKNTEDGKEEKVTYTYDQALEPVVPTDIFPADKRYVFYYPYKAGGELGSEDKTGADIRNFSHNVLANQSTKEAFETSDLLRARVNGTEDESTVGSSVIGHDATGRQQLAVDMEHVMTCIVLRVEKSLVPEDEDLSKEAAGLVNVYRTVSGIDLTRALTPNEQEESDYALSTGEKVDKGNITMNRFGDDTDEYGAACTAYRAVMPAQKVEAGSKFLSFRFNGKNDSETYSLGNTLTFLPGKYYLFTLTKDGGLRFRGIIDDLEDGGDYFYEY